MERVIMNLNAGCWVKANISPSHSTIGRSGNEEISTKNAKKLDFLVDVEKIAQKLNLWLKTYQKAGNENRMRLALERVSEEVVWKFNCVSKSSTTTGQRSINAQKVCAFLHTPHPRANSSPVGGCWTCNGHSSPSSWIERGPAGHRGNSALAMLVILCA